VNTFKKSSLSDKSLSDWMWTTTYIKSTPGGAGGLNPATPMEVD